MIGLLLAPVGIPEPAGAQPTAVRDAVVVGAGVTTDVPVLGATLGDDGGAELLFVAEGSGGGGAAAVGLEEQAPSKTVPSTARGTAAVQGLIG